MDHDKKDDEHQKKGMSEWAKILIVILVLILVGGSVYWLTKQARKGSRTMITGSKFSDEQIYWRR